VKQQWFRWKYAVSILAVVWLVCTAWAIRGRAQATQPSQIKVSGPLFTEAQAIRGEKLFHTQCLGCHRENFHSGEGDMFLTGPHFLERWGLVTLGGMVSIIRQTMPESAQPDALTVQEGTDVVAYILWLNYYPVGSKELPADLPTLNRWTLQTPEEHLQMYIRMAKEQ
jgi:mono/diheme cytochrome c family protein